MKKKDCGYRHHGAWRLATARGAVDTFIKRIDPSFGVVDMGCYEHQFTGAAIIVQ